MAQAIGKVRDFDEKINPISKGINKQIRGAGLSPIQGTIDADNRQSAEIKQQTAEFNKRRALKAQNSAVLSGLAAPSLLTKKAK